MPEQAAVWSYPVADIPTDGGREWVETNITEDRIAMNMINSFLGRMHLASHLDFFNEGQLSLVREGVAYYNKLTAEKKVALPYFPNGFSRWGAESVVAGFETPTTIYLAVWGLKTDRVKINVSTELEKVKIAYPSSSTAKLVFENGELMVVFENSQSAVFLEILK